MFETKIKIFTKFLLFYLVTELNNYKEEFAIGGRSFQYDVMEISMVHVQDGSNGKRSFDALFFKISC